MIFNLQYDHVLAIELLRCFLTSNDLFSRIGKTQTNPLNKWAFCIY